MAMLRKSDASRRVTSQRADLAAAIAAAQYEVAEQAALRSASTAASTASQTADRAVDNARAAVEESVAAMGRHMVATAFGTCGEAPGSLRELRAELAEAEADAEAAKAVFNSVKTRAESQESNSVYLKGIIEKAALAVLRDEAAKAADDAVANMLRLQQALVDQGVVLRWLLKAGLFSLVQEIGGVYGRPKDDSLRNALRRLDNSLSGEFGGINLTADRPWIDALEALKVDAAASLPINETP